MTSIVTAILVFSGGGTESLGLQVVMNFDALFAPGNFIKNSLLQGLGELAITVYSMEEVDHERIFRTS